MGESESSTPRSCHRCSQKKIRCNKAHPCDACLRAVEECRFPGPGRAPRRRKRPLKAQLISRMKSLEEEVRVLNRRLGDRARESGRVDLVDGGHEADDDDDDDDDDEREHGALLGPTQYVNHDVLVGFGNQVSKVALYLDREADM